MRVFSRVELFELVIRVFGFPNVQAFGPSAARAFGGQVFWVWLLSALEHFGAVTLSSGDRAGYSGVRARVFGSGCLCLVYYDAGLGFGFRRSGSGVRLIPFESELGGRVKLQLSGSALQGSSSRARVRASASGSGTRHSG